MKEILERLTPIWGPPGHEHRVAAAISDLLRPHVDALSRDALGNVLAVRRGGGARRVLLSAAMDQPGMVVVHIDERGFVHLAPVGPFKAEIGRGQRVVFPSGAVGVLEAEEKGAVADVGANTREQAAAAVALGDLCVYSAPFAAAGSRLIGPGAGGRGACAVLIEVARRLQGQADDVHFAFTTQSLVGSRSARAAAHSAAPDVALAMEAVGTGDAPRSGTRGEVKLGGGPVLKLKDGGFLSHPDVKAWLERAAEAAGITLQPVLLNDGGSAAQGMLQSADGVPAAALGLPCRHLLTPGEMVDANDMEQAAALILAALGEGYGR